MDFALTGTLIRDARKKLKMTQGELAAGLKMSRATISQLENGTISELGARKLAQVCDRLGLELVVRPRGARPTLHDTYAKNREEREKAFRETDAALSKLT